MNKLILLLALILMIGCDYKVVDVDNVNKVDSTATVTIYIQSKEGGFNYWWDGTYNERCYENVHFSDIDSVKLVYKTEFKALRKQKREDRKTIQD